MRRQLAALQFADVDLWRPIGEIARAFRPHRRDRLFHDLGPDPDLLETSRDRSGDGNYRAPICLDDDLSFRAFELATALAGTHRQYSIAARANFLSHGRARDRLELVSVHLRGQHRPRYRNQSRLFHDAADERAFRRALSS